MGPTFAGASVNIVVVDAAEGDDTITVSPTVGQTTWLFGGSGNDRVQGGSTITQQLVKNTQTGNEQTLQRKIVEAQDAMRLESEFTKDQIFGAYLNTIYMGNSVYGLGTAAQYYFNRSANRLTAAQVLP